MRKNDLDVLEFTVSSKSLFGSHKRREGMESRRRHSPSYDGGVIFASSGRDRPRWLERMVIVLEKENFEAIRHLIWLIYYQRLLIWSSVRR